MIQLSDHFTIRRLLCFTAPSIIMMVFTSIYGVVDGFFVSNFAGKTPFAAVNFIMPVLMILGCPGFMFGTGGSALIAKSLGEKQPETANGIFTMLTVCAAVLGLVLGARDGVQPVCRRRDSARLFREAAQRQSSRLHALPL